MTGRLRRHAVVALLAGSLLALGTGTPAGAAPPSHAGRDVTVASYNLFLGGDIGSLVTAPTPEAFIGAAAALWLNVQATDFPARAEAIADLLAADRPDVAGLQEVAEWQATPFPGAPAAPSYDFLQLVLDALADRGTPYRVIAANTNFVSPVVPVPPLGVQLQFTDRDVVIARAGSAGGHLTASNARAHVFQARIPVDLPAPLPDITVVRGWSTVDVRVNGESFRFANTHLEAFSEAVRNLQAAELAADLASSPLPVVLAGDLNSQPTDGGGAHGQLAGIGLADAWTAGQGPGNTSGQTDSLTNVPSGIDHRIDYVLFQPDGAPTLESAEAHVIGEELADRAVSTVTGSPRLLWPSDHAGVVATLQVGRP